MRLADNLLHRLRECLHWERHRLYLLIQVTQHTVFVALVVETSHRDAAVSPAQSLKNLTVLLPVILGSKLRYHIQYLPALFANRTQGRSHHIPVPEIIQSNLLVHPLIGHHPGTLHLT